MNGAGRRNAGTVRKKRERLGAARRSSATSARIGAVEPAAGAPAAAPAGAEGAGALCSGAALPWRRPGALGSVEPRAAGKVVVREEKVSRPARDDAPPAHPAASPTHPRRALGSRLARSGGPAGRVSGRTPAVGAPAAGAPAPVVPAPAVAIDCSPMPCPRPPEGSPGPPPDRRPPGRAPPSDVPPPPRAVREPGCVATPARPTSRTTSVSGVAGSESVPEGRRESSTWPVPSSSPPNRRGRSKHRLGRPRDFTRGPGDRLDRPRDFTRGPGDRLDRPRDRLGPPSPGVAPPWYPRGGPRRGGGGGWS